jgi:hypothetical protein
MILALAELFRAFRLFIDVARREESSGRSCQPASVYSRPMISILSLPATATDSPSTVIKDFSRS